MWRSSIDTEYEIVGFIHHSKKKYIYIRNADLTGFKISIKVSSIEVLFEENISLF